MSSHSKTAHTKLSALMRSQSCVLITPVLSLKKSAWNRLSDALKSKSSVPMDPVVTSGKSVFPWMAAQWISLTDAQMAPVSSLNQIVLYLRHVVITSPYVWMGPVESPVKIQQ